MKPQCQHSVTGHGETMSRTCMNDAIGDDNGRRYCRLHSPKAQSARDARRRARWAEEHAKDQAAAAAEAEITRKAGLYDLLIATIHSSITQPGATSYVHDGERGNYFKSKRLDEITRQARATLEKAGEKE